MVAHALNPTPGWLVVDCCAAPGNKTTHVAARLKGKGKVIAFDKDPKRWKRLQATVKKAGAGEVVEARLGDFLSIDPLAEEFSQVGV